MATKINIKKENRKNIFQCIYRSKGLSKQDLVNDLAISLPTVNQYTAALLEEGVIELAGTFSSTGGRRAGMLVCKADARHAIGLDITANHVSVVIVDLLGNIIAKERTHLPFSDEESYYETIHARIQGLLLQTRISKDSIEGCGVSLPALIAPNKKTVNYLSIFKPQKDIYEELSHHIDFPILLFNDANAGGFSEAWGNGKKGQFLYLSLSNTVGGAIVSNETIVTGDNDRSGEFGHIPLFPGGRRCYCGMDGCSNMYVNASLLSEEAGGSLEQFFEHVAANEKHYVCVFENYLNDLASLLSILRLCYDCDIVLGGYVGYYMKDYLDQLTQKVSSRNPYETGGDYVKICRYPSDSSAVGSAMYFLEEYLRRSDLK